MLNTVEENKLFLTDFQVRQAKKGLHLHVTLHLQSKISTQLTSADIDLAETIFGPLKGKTISSKPAPVVLDSP